MVKNVCCPQLEIVPCGDTTEHKHLVCSAWQSEGQNITLDNEFLIRHCFKEDGLYGSCPCYPKVG